MTRILGWLACAVSIVLLVIAMVTGTAPASATAVREAQAVRITGAWIRLAAVPGRPAAGYATLSAAAPAVVTGVTSPLARVELHDMTMAGGVMRMDRLRSLRLGAGQTVRFAPGGAHLMLFDVPGSVRPGTALRLNFAFADGSSMAIDAPVRSATAPPALPTTHGTD